MNGATRVNSILGKMEFYLGTHNSINVSVSGGSDSDIVVHMIATYFKHYLSKVRFVFVNTGLEYRATLRHLMFLENTYGIQIHRIKGVPIPTAVRKNGVPFISKRVSDYLSRLQAHNFDFSDVTLDEGLSRFGRVRAALRWWCNDWGDGSMFNISRNKGLKEFLISEKPEIRFSASCCAISKKEPLKKFADDTQADLIITGVRKAEGGVRSSAYSSCFRECAKGPSMFMPLFFMSGDEKAYYESREKIKHSDCYEVWGMRRTGCVGCPFALGRHSELELARAHEPEVYRACLKIFGDAYTLTDKYILSKNNT